MNNILLIIAAANLIGFLQMALDKQLARKRARRIPEAQLITPTLFGGLVGILIGMIAFRHKTIKRSFQLKLASATLLFGATLFLYLSRQQ